VDSHYDVGLEVSTAVTMSSTICLTFRCTRQCRLIRIFVVYWAEFLATDPEVRVQSPALPDFLRSNESGTESTQPRE
jgi:hypothetical protein